MSRASATVPCARTPSRLEAPRQCRGVRQHPSYHRQRCHPPEPLIPDPQCRSRIRHPPPRSWQAGIVVGALSSPDDIDVWWAAISRQDVGVLVQIYGLTGVSDALEVDELGADHIGIVLDEGVETWDSLDLATAKAIATASTRAKVVALSLSSDPTRVQVTADLLEPDVVHLARAHLMDDDVLHRVRASLAPTKMTLTVPIHGPDYVRMAQTPR
jgi:hypothetical protein